MKSFDNLDDTLKRLNLKSETSPKSMKTSGSLQRKAPEVLFLNYFVGVLPPEIKSEIQEHVDDCFDSVFPSHVRLPNGVTIWLEKDDEIIASLAIDPFQGRDFIFNVCVNEEDRGKGYGKILMEYAIKTWSEFSIKHLDGIRDLYLQVLVNNEPALRLYKSMGFKIICTDLEAKIYTMKLDLTGQKEKWNCWNLTPRRA